MTTVTTCKTCGEVKPEDQYYQYKRTGKPRPDCKQCVIDKSKARYYQNNPDVKTHEQRRAERARLTPDDLAEQQRENARRANAKLYATGIGQTGKPRRGTTGYGIRECKQCSADFQARTSNHSYCSKRCKNQANGRTFDENRAARAGVEYEPINHRDVFVRDGWTCGICHDPIDPALAYPHDMSASIDHIRPMARGGPHTYTNVQAAHLQCNRVKWAHEPDTAAAHIA